VAPSSSAKKVAKLASRGKGKKVRFQGGSVFPIAVIVVVLLGVLAIVYGRESRPAAGVGAPTLDDHWHAAFGIYKCDQFEPKILGTAEETTGTDASGNAIFKNAQFALYGIHSHGDGVIHYHPRSTKATGNRAKLGVFLDVYNMKLSDTELIMPADQGGEKYSTKDIKCDGKAVDAKVVVWKKFDSNESNDVVTDFRNVRITNDGMVIVIAFVPKGTVVPKPDWAANLPTLGAADSGAVPAPSSTLVVQTGNSTPVPGSTPAGSTPPGSTPTGSAPPSATTPAPATTGG
jgi:hypothetical protein